MAAVTLSNVKKSFGDRDLFENVSFFVNERERVALVGANGSGKTTILRMIAAEVRPDSGSVTKEPRLTVGHLPQEVDLPDTAGLHLAVTGVTPELLACASELADLERVILNPSASLRTGSVKNPDAEILRDAQNDVGDAQNDTDDHARGIGTRYADVSHQFDTLGGFDYQRQAGLILSGLGFPESDFDKPVRTLSGGQKTRAALARLLLLSPDLLLLDEPTNHLDIDACEWLQGFLQTRYTGAALVVSHDRYFLDQVVSKVVELENGSVATYPGNYSAFARMKAARIEEQRKLYKEQQKEIARIEQAIQTLFSQRKFSRRDSKVKQLERIERIERLRDQQTIRVGIAAAVRSGREVVRLSKLAKSFPGTDLFSDVSFTLERGRKVGIVGPNGSGKTTLLKIIAEREPADSGEVILGHNVKPVYFAQEFGHLVGSRTVIEELLADADLSAREARDLLARFLFLGDDAFKLVEVLSGGELCRLALAKVLAAGPNLLLLDEPTNHLDIPSRESLEDALTAFNGTVLAASHDRYLLDAICDEIIELKDGRFSHHLGNYSVYRARSHQAAERTALPQSPTPSSQPPAPRPLSSLRETERLLREHAKRQRDLEQVIAGVENRIREVTEALGDEQTYRGGSARELSNEYDQLSDRLPRLYGEWEELSDRVRQVEERLAELRGD